MTKLKNSSFVIAATILLLFSLGSLYCQIVVSDSKEKLKKSKQKLYPTKNVVGAELELSKDAHLLKIRHRVLTNERTEIRFNGLEFAPNAWPYIRRRADVENRYVYLPKKVVKTGKNTIHISFSNDPPAEINITLFNYRKNLDGYIYVLFSDSAHSPPNRILLRTTPYANVVILGLWITICFLSKTLSGGNKHLFIYRHRYLLSFLFFLSFLLLWLNSHLAYKIVVAPGFFWSAVLISSGVTSIRHLPETAKASFKLASKTTDHLLTETEFDVRVGVPFVLLVIVANLWVYWPSFFHLFRHDEWFLFFVSRDAPPNLEFLVKHIDWQLRLPYDRLMFRPLSQGMVALNRVVFDANYIGPHILTFLKHILTTFCLWWLMWQLNPRWISWLFALLFSVLVVSADPIIWPLLDAYILTTIFTILAVMIFRKTMYNQTSVLRGFAWLTLLLFLNLLTSEIAFPMPFAFFLAYWTIFRDRREPTFRKKDRCIWLVLLLPIALSAALYSVHLYSAYPDFRMTPQSSTIGLWRPIINMARCILVLLSGMAFPMFARTRYLDKMYFVAFPAGITLATASIVICIRLRKKMLRRATREVLFSTMLVFAVLAVICFSRAAYLNNLLDSSKLPGHYVYCVSALVILAIYALIDFDKVASSSKSSLVLFTVLVFLIVSHGVKTNQAALEIDKRTAHLKKYFDSVSSFVLGHKNEPDFSFKIIDRPPKITAFPWYHETCVDGLFNRFIDNKTPRYVLEYNPLSEELKYSLYQEYQPGIVRSDSTTNVSQEPDYINSLGMQFEKVSRGGYHFLMGIVEVTQKQWKAVMGANPSRFINDDHPVENVSYDMVQELVRHLNKTEGDGFYRLPTVEEYSYLVNISPLSQAPSNIKEHAWLKHNSQGTTHPVGSLSPLIGGFHDLIGNVWEWTKDPIYYDSELQSLQTAPHLCFGGSWRDDDISMDNLITNYPLDFRHEHLGFRLVKEIGNSVEKE
ncbi:MAG: SUMF1/EgtB/PvdO family nonheme iron enzyme [Planctomycetota bacterium]